MKNYTLRKMSEELHRDLKIQAAIENKSIQTLIIELLTEALKKRQEVEK